MEYNFLHISVIRTDFSLGICNFAHRKSTNSQRKFVNTKSDKKSVGFIARRAIVFAMIGSGTRKLMCESCLSDVVWDVTLRSRSGNHLHHLRAISQKFDFFAFLSVFVKVFSRFSFRFVEITADDA